MSWRRVAAPMRPHIRVGFFGGTFDPPHLGHSEIVTSAIEELRLDAVVICPSGYPHGKTPLFSANERWELCQEWLKTLPGGRVSLADDEMLWMKASSAPSRTVDTLKRMVSENYPLSRGLNAEWFLLMGQDQAESFDQWYEAARIAEMAQPVYLERAADSISSSMIRYLLRSGDVDAALARMPEGVGTKMLEMWNAKAT